MIPVASETVAPPDTLSAPVPNCPTTSVPPDACRFDPAPLTDILSMLTLLPSGSRPTEIDGAETCAPPVMLTTPVLASGPKPAELNNPTPTVSCDRLVHFEPAPSTVTVLTVPFGEESPTIPKPSMT
jgi:hypothetical protein